MSSSVPSAIPAFLTLIEDALPDTSQVLLGATFPPFVAPVTVILTRVAFTADEYAELGPNYKHEEHYNLVCCLYNNGGMYQDQPDLLTLMQATYTLYDDISVAVANNPTLGLDYGTTGFRLAWCRQMDFIPDFDVNGRSFGKLDFVVECQARVYSLS